MKKLRMIVTSVVVLAIVGGAFAFKTKSSAFCVVIDSAGSTNCTTFIQDVKKTTGIGTTYKYYPCWEFDKTACTPNGIGKCTAQAVLTID